MSYDHGDDICGRVAEAYGYLGGAVQNHLAKRDAESLAWLEKSLAEADRMFEGRKNKEVA